MGTKCTSVCPDRLFNLHHVQTTGFLKCLSFWNFNDLCSQRECSILYRIHGRVLRATYHLRAAYLLLPNRYTKKSVLEVSIQYSLLYVCWVCLVEWDWAASPSPFWRCTVLLSAVFFASYHAIIEVIIPQACQNWKDLLVNLITMVTGRQHYICNSPVYSQIPWAMSSTYMLSIRWSDLGALPPPPYGFTPAFLLLFAILWCERTQA